MGDIEVDCPNLPCSVQLQDTLTSDDQIVLLMGGRNPFPRLMPVWCHRLGRQSISQGISSKFHICLWITIAMTLIWSLTITLKFSRGSKLPQVGHRNQKNKMLCTSQEPKPSILQVQTEKKCQHQYQWLNPSSLEPNIKWTTEK